VSIIENLDAMSEQIDRVTRLLDEERNKRIAAERELAEVRALLLELEQRLDSAAAETDCFNVYESLSLVKAALAAKDAAAG
jgi:hypothetical protein